MNDNQTIPVLTSLALPDGGLIERLSGSRLAVWRDGTTTVATEAQAGECRYVVGELDKDLEAALKLPVRIDDDATPAQLLADVEALLTNEAGLPSAQAVLLAGAVVCSWVADYLAKPVWVHLWSQDSESGVMPLLAALVRQPLLFAHVSAGELAQVPAGLCPTVLLLNPSARALDDVGLVTSLDGAALLRSGRLLRLPRCSAFTRGEHPTSRATVQLPLPSASTCGALNPARLLEIEDQFRPRLVSFRLRHHDQIAHACYAGDLLAPGIAGAAQLLPLAMVAGPEWGDRVLDALREEDEGRKAGMSQTDAAYVLEALLVAIHEGRERAIVGDLADLTNVILCGRQQHRTLSAKAVGAILRNEIGLSTCRHGAGYIVKLTGDTVSRIHQSAYAYGCLSTITPAPDCTWCEEIHADDLDSSSESSRTGDDVHQVHQVHEVHSVAGGESADEPGEIL